MFLEWSYIMKYRIKAYHYKRYSKYVPQRKFLWFWIRFKHVTVLGNYAEFFSKIKAQKYLDDHIDLTNPRIENIPYEN